MAVVDLDTRPPERSGVWKKPRPQVGLAVLLVCAAFPVRFAIGGGMTASVFDVAAWTLCTAQLMLMVQVVRPWPRVPRHLLVGILGPGLLAATSMFWTQLPAETLKAVVSWAESLLVVVYVVVVLRDQYPRTVIRWVARFGLLLLVAPLLMYAHVRGFEPPANLDRLNGDFLSFYTRFSHPFIGRSNNLATLLAMLFLPLAYWSAMQRRHRVATLLIGAALVATLSRGVLIGVVIGAFVMAVRNRERAGRLIRRLGILAALGVLPAIAAVIYNPLVAQHIGDRLTSGGVSSRQVLLNQGWGVIGQHPILGVGAGVGDSIHNTYLQQLVYFGVVLGVVMALMIACIPLWFFGKGDFVRAAGMGVAAAWVSLLFESSLEGVLLRPLCFLCVGLCVALARSERLLDPKSAVGVALPAAVDDTDRARNLVATRGKVGAPASQQ